MKLEILMNKFEWGNIKDPKVNIDYFHDNTIGVMKYRNTFFRLAAQLHEEGKDDKATAVLDKSLEELPFPQVPIDNNLGFYVALYYSLNQIDKGNALARDLIKENIQMLKYVHSLSPADAATGEVQREEDSSMRLLELLLRASIDAGQTEIAQEIRNEVARIYNPTQVTPVVPEGGKSIKDSSVS